MQTGLPLSVVSKKLYYNKDILKCVEGFYMDYYNELKLDEVADREYASKIFSFAIHTGDLKRTKELRAKAKNVKDFTRLMVLHYIDIVDKNPDKKRFLEGWINRAFF
jgi:maltose-binding protein MalE